MTNEQKGFIAQTANDYCIDIQTVEKMYKEYPNTYDFYKALERYIENRAI
jgi:hypothetical protein